MGAQWLVIGAPEAVVSGPQQRSSVVVRIRRWSSAVVGAKVGDARTSANPGPFSYTMGVEENQS